MFTTQTVTPSSPGIDYFAGLPGATQSFMGTADHDTLVGSKGNDWLFGLEGDDVLSGDNGNDMLAGFAGDDRLYGGDGNDTFNGGPGHDWLSGGFGNDLLNGGYGSDTDVAIYEGNLADFAIQSIANIASSELMFTVIDNREPLPNQQGRDTLEGVERLIFNDFTVSLDFRADSATVLAAKLVGLLAKEQLVDPAVMGYMLSEFGIVRNPYSYGHTPEVALELVAQRLWDKGVIQNYHALDSAPQGLIGLLYRNLTGADATEQVMQSLASQWASQDMWQGKLIAAAAQLPVNAVNIDLVGLSSSGIAYMPSFALTGTI